MQYLAFIFLVSLGQAQTTVSTTEVEAQSHPSLWQRYRHYYDEQLSAVLAKPLWGNTTQLPKGLIKIKYDFVAASATRFFNGQGKSVPLMPPIVFADFPSAGDRLVIKPKVQGHGGEHKFFVSYGITDLLNAFLQMPFTSADTSLKLRLTNNGQPLGDLERAVLESYIQANGRPLPGNKFHGTMDLGDMRGGVSWNAFRNDVVSFALIPAITFPTGKVADPNNSLTFILGPEIDRGMHAWAANLTATFDVRPLQWLIFSFETNASYRFPYERKSPKWLPIKNCKRLQDQAQRDQYCSTSSAPYDPLYDLQMSRVFPNMSKLAKTYRVLPGLSTGLTAALIFNIKGISLQGAWQFSHNEAPTIKVKGRTASGAAFESFTRSVELFAASEIHVLAVGLQLPLFPFYIPLRLTPTARFVVAGKNVVRLDNQFGITVEFFLPLLDLVTH